MHFALLVSQLPHVEDARAQYDDLMTLEWRTHRIRLAASSIWSVVSKLVGRRIP